MLDFAIFAVTFVVLVALIGLLIIYFPTTSPKLTTVPGLEPSDPVKGNLDEIADAGSLHEFLTKLHGDYGDIASFYFTDQLCVSIASPALFKEHRAVFDRPPLLFKMFEPLMTPHSIQYANGVDGRRRRDLTDRCFGFQAVHNYIGIFNEAVGELVKKLSDLPADKHVPLYATSQDIAMKALMRTSFGEYFKTDASIATLWKGYDFVFADMEKQLRGDVAEAGSKREKQIEEEIQQLHRTMKEVAELRRADPPTLDKEIFIDVLLKNDSPDARLTADLISYGIGGLSTGNMLVWALYFLAKDKAIQEKLADHVTSVAGKTGEITMDHISEMNYMRQVLDETIRASILSPYAARFQDYDVTLGGHVIPKGTPVLHALGVSLQSDKSFPDPKIFNPENFSPENVKKRPPDAFRPFGFAGRRVCPGRQFAYKEVAIFLGAFVRAFKVKLVPGQEVVSVHGLVTHLESKDGGDVWITVEKRL